MRTRTYRRFRNKVRLAHAYYIVHTIWQYRNPEGDWEWRQARQIRDNPAICSCDECGNPRHRAFIAKKKRDPIRDRRKMINDEE